MKLRAHHLLCIAKFNNSGWYSKDYEKNFKKIYSHLEKNPETKIKIIRQCDDICKQCPFIKERICNKPSKYKISHWVRVMDNKIMRLIKIKPDSTHNTKDILIKLKEKIKNQNLKNICKGCEYLDDCLKYGTNKSFVSKLK